MSDLRTFLSRLREERPQDILEIDSEIDGQYELSYLQWKLEDLGRYPLVIANNARGYNGRRSKFPIVSNVFASRDRCAWSIGSTSEQVAFEYAERVHRRRPTEVVAAGTAPCQSVVKQGDEIDLYELPAPVHHEWDPGPYLTAGFVAMKWPGREAYNQGLHRCYIRSKNTMASFFSFAKHNWHILKENAANGLSTRVVVWLGHHPGAYLGSQARTASFSDEYQVPGAFTDGPFRLAPSVTWGDEFLVPADAEFVVEGEIRPGQEVAEAPFGEYTRYYGEQRYSPLIEVTALTHRADAIFHDILVSHADNQVMGGFALEGKVFEAVRNVVLGVENVHLPLSGCCRFICYIKIDKKTDGEGKLALAAALPVDSRIKYVVVVDKDIDIFNESEVLWAIATRTKLPDDAVVITDIVGEGLDPSGTDQGLINKVGIDATKPVGVAFAERVGFPPDVAQTFDLGKYVSPDRMAKFPPG
ncbi:MAG: UbiD family decarboxylase [Chloroflexi bacterium]|nr:UbiD family decarboxylase [Chloroflexota bacterium]